VGGTTAVTAGAVAVAVATGTDGAGRRRASYALAAGALASVAALSLAAPAGPSVELKVSRRGFVPSRITLRRGETARLALTSDDGEHCFAIDALRIEKRVARDRPTRLELTPERTGSFPFYCCLESGKQAELERGELVVSE
jgi:heme/copper-type cytochrome/quinol oxidase subunit 2